MRYLLSKSQRVEIAAGLPSFTIKYSESRGRDTYGWNICTLREYGQKIARCNGGGYDMAGTVFAEWVKVHFAAELEKLAADDFFALDFFDPIAKKHRKHFRSGYKICLDGGCGFASIERVLEKIGFEVRKIERYRFGGGRYVVVAK